LFSSREGIVNGGTSSVTVVWGERTLAKGGGRGFPRPDREEKGDFAEVQVYNLNQIQNEHQRRKTTFSEYFDPN